MNVVNVSMDTLPIGATTIHKAGEILLVGCIVDIVVIVCFLIVAGQVEMHSVWLHLLGDLAQPLILGFLFLGLSNLLLGSSLLGLQLVLFFFIMEAAIPERVMGPERFFALWCA